MTGSLQVKNDRFFIVLSKSENGKRQQKWIATGLPTKGNKRKAEQMLREAMIEYDKQPQFAKSNMLFTDCVQLWLEAVRRRVDVVTYQGYELIAKTQVIPFFEARHIKLRNVTINLLQEFFDEKAARGRKDGKGGLSPASLRRYRNVINQTLNHAIRNGWLFSNPCQLVELPKEEHYESSFYTENQLKRLFEETKGDPIYPLIKITALYGLRRSEVLGLKWDSVDFDSGRLTIKHTVAKVVKTIEKDKTKNSSSHRSFPLTPEARAIFLDVRKAEQESRRLFGKGYIESDYIFKWPDGKPFSPDYVSQHFALLLKNKGLPHIRFHELRHPCVKQKTKILEFLVPYKLKGVGIL